NIQDIDHTFTLGDMARKRQEIINKLKAEGVFNLNKEIPLPLFAQRIAVISSATAAGYGDFCDQLENNVFGFVFYPVLFSAIMQGEKIEASIIEVLNMINDRRDDFDCVVIIRGGGATSDLSGFDTLALAENVANFPLPVITGIGHERDESILDMVSHTRVKTPTAAAAFLIDNLATVLKYINECSDRIVNSVKNRLNVERMRLDIVSKRIPELLSVLMTRNVSGLDSLLNRLTSAMRLKIERSANRLDVISSSIPQFIKNKMMSEHHRIDLLTQRVKALDPELTLKRGYSITLHNGFAVHDASKLRKGDRLLTRLEKGSVRSVVED
ncbi:MAG: exodeoxyribonuclease VII large subunit, partial [Prevotella sp.]|nr:exodeoxyribonuclease VII large subunit [Prevotella sp.]